MNILFTKIEIVLSEPYFFLINSKKNIYLDFD